MKKRFKQVITKYFLIAVILFVGVLFLWKFGLPQFLRAYLQFGIGNCDRIPILCKMPQEDLGQVGVNKEFIYTLVEYRFPDTKILIPRQFNVVFERIRKYYYKKHKRMDKGATIYLLHEPVDFFITLFPDIRKRGVEDDYEFLTRTMYANLGTVNDVTDAFFVIMKSIFVPNLSDQNHVKMVRVNFGDKRAFINYYLSENGNFFDCSLVSLNEGFFKIYIKDPLAQLDLEKVIAIASTIHALN
ncbi:MAG: hypothetical protein HY761_07655 [Candidatus Omnitrophica bacterium]|nr:hypothetical protein [Candidatus Omnitrophota bacterium]